MADTPEEVASQLKEFIEAVQEISTRGPVVSDYRPSISQPQKPAKLKICEKCVHRLTDQDRTNLLRILKEMSLVLVERA